VADRILDVDNIPVRFWVGPSSLNKRILVLYMDKERIKEFLRNSLLYCSATFSIGLGAVGLVGKISELREPINGVHNVKLIKREHCKDYTGGDIHSYVEFDRIYVSGCNEPIYFSSVGEIPDGRLSITFKRKSGIFAGGLEGISIGPYVSGTEEKSHLVTK